MKKIVIGIIGIGLIYLSGCASTVDSLSNNSSGVAIRGTKMSIGVDATGSVPAPSASLIMGSLARKGKADRMIVTIDNQATNIVSEDYNIDSSYDTSNEKRQLLSKETRTSTKELGEKGINIEQNCGLNFGIVSGNLFTNGGSTKIAIGNGNNNGSQTITPTPTPSSTK